MASGIVRRWLANAPGHYGALGRLEKEFRARSDLLRIAVQDGLIIDVFWKSLPIKKRPALSVFVCGDDRQSALEPCIYFIQGTRPRPGIKCATSSFFRAPRACGSIG